jgi:hypothetical protein
MLILRLQPGRLFPHSLQFFRLRLAYESIVPNMRVGNSIQNCGQ